MGKKKKYTQQQLAIIRRNYAQKAAQKKNSPPIKATDSKKQFPEEFPFWARLKISKNRPTLVIDEALAKNTKKKKMEEGFVHREVIHTKKSDYEEVNPNPDPNDDRPMFLKRPTKTPQRLFNPMNEEWSMPEELRQRYEKNNHKKE